MFLLSARSLAQAEPGSRNEGNLLQDASPQFTFPVSQPSGLVSDSRRNRLYVASKDKKQVVVWDEIGRKNIKTIPVGANPWGLGLVNDRLFVANYKSGTVSVINAATMTKMTDINLNNSRAPVQCAGGPANVAVNSITRRVYVAMYGAARVAVVDATNNTLIDCLPTGGGTFGVAVNPELNQLYVANRDAMTLQVFDAGAMPARLIQTQPLGGVPLFVQAAAGPNRVYVMVAYDAPNHQVANGLTAFTATATGITLSKKATIGNSMDGGTIWVSQANGALYIAATHDNQLQIVDPASLTFLRTIAVKDPYGITENRGLGRMYIASRAGGLVRVESDSLGAPAAPIATATLTRTPTRTSTDTPVLTFTGTPTSTSIPAVSDSPTLSPTPTFTGTPTAKAPPSPVPSGTLAATATRPSSPCTPSPIGTVVVGSHPKGIAADPTTGRIFVSLFDTSSVGVIEGSSNQLLAQWSTGASGHANGIGVTNGRVFVALRDTGKVAILDSATGGPIANQSVGSSPFGVGAANGKVWIADFGSGTTHVIDGATGNIVAATAVGANPSLIAAAGDRAFVTTWDGGVALVGADGKLLQSWKLSSGSFGIAYDPVKNRVYVSNRVSRQIVMMDGSTGTILKSVTLTETPFALAFNPNSGHLFAVLAESNRVDVRDDATLDRIAVIPVGSQGNDGGDGIALLGNRLFVSDNAANAVSVLSDECGPTPSPAKPTVSPTATATPTATWDASGGVQVNEGVITFSAYNYQAYQTNALDLLFNLAYNRFNYPAFLATPQATTQRTFTTVVMENDYLRLTFLPALGGRLYQVLFKPTGQTLFYNNKVLKPTNWGPAQQSGWLAVGGMEWALPVDEHGYEWGIPWQYSISRSSSSATIRLSDTTSSDRVRAQVSVTLPEHAAYFILHPRIENPTAAPLALQFWINAQVALNNKNVSPDTEFILPADQVYVHSTGDAFIPPAAVPPDGAMGPSAPIGWPVIGGRDLSFYSNWDDYLGVFLDSPQANFMGAYDHAGELGIARVFSPGQVGGAKLFAFGPNFTQRNVYTDDGSDYFELWGGLPRTFFQNDNVTLAAGESREWEEYWVPFANTGGLSAATRDAVLGLSVRVGQANVGAAATNQGTRGALVLQRDGVEIKRWDLALEPGNAFRDQVAVPDGGHLKLVLTDPDGTPLAETK